VSLTFQLGTGNRNSCIVGAAGRCESGFCRGGCRGPISVALNPEWYSFMYCKTAHLSSSSSSSLRPQSFGDSSIADL
jgi:hypothetical protein